MSITVIIIGILVYAVGYVALDAFKDWLTTDEN